MSDNSNNTGSHGKGGEGAKGFGQKIEGYLADLGPKFSRFVSRTLPKCLIIGIIVTVVLLILILVLSHVVVHTFFKNSLNQCVEDINLSQNESDNYIKAFASDAGEFAVNNAYRYEITTQKIHPISLQGGVSKNYDPLIIDITGQWTPWFGDVDDPQTRELSTPSTDFVCKMKRVQLNSTYAARYGKTQQEREYYFMKNYYADVRPKSTSNADLDYSNVLDATYQEPCWLNRGMGLYMGFYGITGKTQPQYFHHLLANQAVCEIYNFVPEAGTLGNIMSINKNYVINERSASNVANIKRSIKEKDELRSQLRKELKLAQEHFQDYAILFDTVDNNSLISTCFKTIPPNLDCSSATFSVSSATCTLPSAGSDKVKYFQFSKFVEAYEKDKKSITISGTKSNVVDVEGFKSVELCRDFCLNLGGNFDCKIQYQIVEETDKGKNTYVYVPQPTDCVARTCKEQIGSISALIDSYKKSIVKLDNEIDNLENELTKAAATSYKMSDYIRDHYSVSYYLERDKSYYTSYCAQIQNDPNQTERLHIASDDAFCKAHSGDLAQYFDQKIQAAKYEESNILLNKLFITYNIHLHEDLLYKYNVRNPEEIIARSTSSFMKACYGDVKKIIKKPDGTADTKIVREYRGTFRFTEDDFKICKEYESDGQCQTKYAFGEKAKFLILDRYYSDNQGGFNLNFMSGVTVTSDASIIESSLLKIEHFLLGTPYVSPGRDDREVAKYDRSDGIINKVYTNIVSDTFRNIVRVVLALYIALYGFGIIMGYKQFNKHEFIVFCLKMAFLFTIIDRDGWNFFNKTFINFFVNGTIGIIDFLYRIFSSIFTTFDYNDNVVFNFIDVNATSNLNLSKYFRFIDHIFALFFSQVFHLKIFGMVTTYYYLIGGLVVAIIWYLIFTYIMALLGAIIPYISILIQIAILLPLAPLFLLFMFFETTKGYFKKWLNYLMSRCCELVVFFFTLFFATGLVNEQIMNIFNYEVCHKTMYTILTEKYPDIKTKKTLDTIVNALTNFVDEIVITDAVSLTALLVQLLILAIYIFLFKHFTSVLADLITSMFSFDGEGYAQNTSGSSPFGESLGQAVSNSIGGKGILGAIPAGSGFRRLVNRDPFPFGRLRGVIGGFKDAGAAMISGTNYREAKDLRNLRKQLKRSGNNLDLHGRYMGATRQYDKKLSKFFKAASSDGGDLEKKFSSLFSSMAENNQRFRSISNTAPQNNGLRASELARLRQENQANSAETEALLREAALQNVKGLLQQIRSNDGADPLEKDRLRQEMSRNLTLAMRLGAIDPSKIGAVFGNKGGLEKVENIKSLNKTAFSLTFSEERLIDLMGSYGGDAGKTSGLDSNSLMSIYMNNQGLAQGRGVLSYGLSGRSGFDGFFARNYRFAEGNRRWIDYREDRMFRRRSNSLWDKRLDLLKTEGVEGGKARSFMERIFRSSDHVANLRDLHGLTPISSLGRDVDQVNRIETLFNNINARQILAELLSTGSYDRDLDDRVKHMAERRKMLLTLESEYAAVMNAMPEEMREQMKADITSYSAGLEEIGQIAANLTLDPKQLSDSFGINVDGLSYDGGVELPGERPVDATIPEVDQDQEFRRKTNELLLKMAKMQKSIVDFQIGQANNAEDVNSGNNQATTELTEKQAELEKKIDDLEKQQQRMSPLQA